ncbi:SRPBCC family protein [Shewanella marinintestina]|uniref:SRPBCC family protein n=1 Tax=Shewanella marinintestina TaxID=190305 RepID=UPI00200EFB97|nr:SRPBCC family protein [Shewanella marinintestina]MCL1145355.1 SRPBCC family protein [Shewanella marinintestina]
MKNYYEIDILKNFYLEDSYVIDIKETENSIIFYMEFVLKPAHSSYSEPLDDEQYCYKSGTIEFMNCSSITWISRAKQTFTDRNENVDYGNIDSFFRKGDVNYLEGDWGIVEFANLERNIAITLSENM